MAIQVGANDGQTINIDLQKIDSSTLGLGGFSLFSELPETERFYHSDR
jgi:flagellin-like hook-associated protein FlgL